MTSTTTSTSGRRRNRYTWTEESRLVLHLINDKFSLSRPMRAKVFRSYVRDVSGSPSSLTDNAIGSQYAERRYPKRAHIWKAVLADPTTDEQRQRQRRLITRIQSLIAVQGAGPLVSARVHRAPPPPPPPAPQTLRRTISQRDITPTSSSRWPHTTPRQYQASQRAQAPRQAQAAPAKWNGLHRFIKSATPARSQQTPTASKSLTVAVRKPAKRQAPITPPQSSSKRVKTLSVVASVQISAAEQFESLEDFELGALRPRREHAKTPVRSSKVLYTRRDGELIKINASTAKKLEQLEKLDPVPAAAAHPPLAGLFFRYHDENTYTKERAEGFTCSYYEAFPPAHVGPPPNSVDLDLADVFHHLNKPKDGNKCRSKFVSVSNHFAWILRLAAKQAKEGAEEGKISVISADALDPKGVYHVPPFWRECKRTYGFSNGAQKYSGTYEFIVWHRIPRSAIIHTFTMFALKEYCQRVPHLGSILRFDTIRIRRAWEKTILPMLAADGIELDVRTVTALAKLCRFIGLAPAPKNQLQQAVSDLIQGWKIQVRHLSEEEWADLTQYWVHGLSDRTTINSLEREQTLKMCFLHAVREGLAPFNLQHKPKAIAGMKKAGGDVGLGSPKRIALSALERGRAAILEQEDEQEEK
jgi:hypothetical protein